MEVHITQNRLIFITEINVFFINDDGVADVTAIEWPLIRLHFLPIQIAFVLFLSHALLSFSLSLSISFALYRPSIPFFLMFIIDFSPSYWQMEVSEMGKVPK